MPKVTSLEELRTLKENFKAQILVRQKGDKINELTVIRVGMSDCGIKAGAKAIMDELTCKTREREDVVVLQGACMGDCENEPILAIKFPTENEPVVYKNVTSARIDELLATTLAK